MDSSSHTIALAANRLEPVPEVVALIADLLKRAQAGEIRGFAFAAACNAGDDAHGMAVGDMSIASLYLGIERCKLSLLNEDCGTVEW